MICEDVDELLAFLGACGVCCVLSEGVVCLGVEVVFCWLQRSEGDGSDNNWDFALLDAKDFESNCLKKRSFIMLLVVGFHTNFNTFSLSIASFKLSIIRTVFYNSWFVYPFSNRKSLILRKLVLSCCCNMWRKIWSSSFIVEPDRSSLWLRGCCGFWFL